MSDTLVDVVSHVVTDTVDYTATIGDGVVVTHAYTVVDVVSHVVTDTVVDPATDGGVTVGVAVSVSVPCVRHRGEGRLQCEHVGVEWWESQHVYSGW